MPQTSMPVVHSERVPSAGASARRVDWASRAARSRDDPARVLLNERCTRQGRCGMRAPRADLFMPLRVSTGVRHSHTRSMEDERVTKLLSAVQPFHDALRPVIRVEEGSGGQRIEGTATVVHEGTGRFVLTAHHVVMGDLTCYLGVRGRPSVRWPSAYSVLEPLLSTAFDADIAWAHARVGAEQSDLEGGLPMAMAVTSLDDSANTMYVAAGYPASKAKVRMGLGSAEARLMFAVVELAPPAGWRPSGFDPAVQMAFKYSQTGRSNAQGEAAVGAHPKGMSGGAVFAIGQSRSSSAPLYMPFLVGLLTQFHEDHGLLVATRIRHIWESLGLQQPRNQPLFRPRDA